MGLVDFANREEDKIDRVSNIFAAEYSNSNSVPTRTRNECPKCNTENKDMPGLPLFAGIFKCTRHTLIGAAMPRKTELKLFKGKEVRHVPLLTSSAVIVEMKEHDRTKEMITLIMLPTNHHLIDGKRRRILTVSVSIRSGRCSGN